MHSYRIALSCTMRYGRCFVLSIALVPVLDLGALADGVLPAPDPPLSPPCSIEVHHGWKACRRPSLPSHGCASDSLLNVSTLPTTALAVLLDNQQIPGVEDISMNDIYFSTNMALLPDIYDVGRDYYTLLYELEIPPLTQLAACHSSFSPARRQTIRLAGTNYQSKAWLDGVALAELASHGGAPGMFVRRNFNVTTGGRLNILVEPPYHPGNPHSGGQGGDHSLAKDGATAQFMLGWDWSQAMPDRATGFFGSVVLEQSGSIALLDPAIQTLEIDCANITECSMVRLRALVRVEGLDDDLAQLKSSFTLKIASDWGENWYFDDVSLSEAEEFQRELLVMNPEKTKLWWPHGIGVERSAHLHTISFSLSANGKMVDAKTIRVGIRTIQTYLDQTLQGQRFQINGKEIYLVGGNWITSDQALRFSSSEKRYCDEIAIHRQAGLNLLRVWGGGVAEQSQFYSCADRLGILVFQEFWMTGDNNGRWGGNYSHPLDYEAYLENVEDTVKRLRPHPSLLFYGGCNECLAPRNSTWAPNPPGPINDGIQRILEQFDPGRFYIPSSMGGANVADTFFDPTIAHNRSYSLAYADGPYGMRLPREFFDRNPGLPLKHVCIGFQPEIGSVSAPTLSGLLRFMSQTEIDRGFPRRDELESNRGTWEFHKSMSWASRIQNETYDHVYAYFPPETEVTAADWVAASQLAAYSQYQSLFNGFVRFLFVYTSAVVMWKTQSPWPALRGFLYDWFLESTGTLRGVRSSLRNSVSVIFDHSTWTLSIVNRQIFPLVGCSNASIGAEFSLFDVYGELVDIGVVHLLRSSIPAMSVALVSEKQLQWPSHCTSVCFLRLRELGSCDSHTRLPSWYWLTDPSLGAASNFSMLGVLRARQQGRGTLDVVDCIMSQSRLILNVSVNVDPGAPEILLYPSIQLYSADDGSGILPIFDSGDTDVVLLPGSSRMRVLESTNCALGSSGHNPTHVRVVMTSWNGPDVFEDALCANVAEPVGVSEQRS